MSSLLVPGSRVRVPPLLVAPPPETPAVRSFWASQGSRGRAILVGLGILATVTVTLGAARIGEFADPASAQSADSVLIAAAGDLVCGTGTQTQIIPCLELMTADVVRKLKPDALLLLGDLQYEAGSLADFQSYFEAAFGEFKSITYPVPGNHEYFTPGAAGYFDYFNGVGADSGRAGRRGRGYYSFNLGAWHIVALNSNCLEIGGCSARSAQAAWLRADLASNKAKCTLAFSHSARFSSGLHGNDELMRDLWQIMHEAGVDVVLSGHDHHYERFLRQDARGRPDEKRGILAFVLGTGGKGLAPIGRRRSNSAVHDNSSIGVLTMVLRPDSYSWKFAPGSDPRMKLDDAGDGTCHD
jgi:3',5'-cyclic AMP phosphodiesterase CpdA